jgi:predicted nuclease of predicted toxin-antitoxin system
MAREGYDVIHAKDIDFVNAEDSAIRDYALENDYVVISKDDDFTAYVAESQGSL